MAKIAAAMKVVFLCFVAFSVSAAQAKNNDPCKGRDDCFVIQEVKIIVELKKDKKKTVLSTFADWSVQLRVHDGAIVGQKKAFSTGGKAEFDILNTTIPSYVDLFGPNHFTTSLPVRLDKGKTITVFIPCENWVTKKQACQPATGTN